MVMNDDVSWLLGGRVPVKSLGAYPLIYIKARKDSLATKEHVPLENILAEEELLYSFSSKLSLDGLSLIMRLLGERNPEKHKNKSRLLRKTINNLSDYTENVNGIFSIIMKKEETDKLREARLVSNERRGEAILASLYDFVNGLYIYMINKGVNKKTADNNNLDSLIKKYSSFHYELLSRRDERKKRVIRVPRRLLSHLYYTRALLSFLKGDGNQERFNALIKWAYLFYAKNNNGDYPKSGIHAFSMGGPFDTPLSPLLNMASFFGITYPKISDGGSCSSHLEEEEEKAAVSFLLSSVHSYINYLGGSIGKYNKGAGLEEAAMHTGVAINEINTLSKRYYTRLYRKLSSQGTVDYNQLNRFSNNNRLYNHAMENAQRIIKLLVNHK